ncbi:GAF domain-containing protein [Cronbergia sp. UHCC 0137]|uniref:GAF domain-containing protein n=1 Tax=Cronbergia sp. UHCC 0137 TaxID=3110239 RepID=UPI002B1F1A9F|nr:GAF domain-containing protein [Cronbergia sp. UHCC 0137]MEA5617705.1 GAF domain-containing protein [Cronbergia sp. UHCC 0137]
MLTPINALSETELKLAIVRNPLMVTPDKTVMEAIAQMSGVRAICSVSQATDSQLESLLIDARSSCVIVVENNQPLGIFTERDVVRLSAQKRNLENLAIRDAMAHPVITLRESEFNDLFFAVNLLQHHRIRHLPVVDEQNQLVGLLTHESLRQRSRPVDLLRLRLVNEVMTRKVISAAADVSILAIAGLMAENRVSSVMIVQVQESRQIPIGIVTERDIVQFQALNLNFETCTAQAVMSTPVFCVNPDESLWTVQQIMGQRLIQRLAVTGKQGELLGIVTQSSILQVLNPLELYKLTEVLEQKVLQLEAEKIELLENRTIKLEQKVEERTIALQKKVEREKLITKVAAQISSSLDLQNILNTTVAEMRSLLKCDRVIIYQFHPDLTGKVIAESVVTDGISILHNEPQDRCLTPELLEPYLQGQIQVINDLYCESMSECHQNLLIKLDIRAKLMVPIIVENKLWGLILTSYRHTPHDWEVDEIELVRQLSIQVAIAIQQANIYQQAQIELRQRQQAESKLYHLNHELEARVQQRTAELRMLLQTTQHIRQSLDLSTIFNTATQEIRQLINVDRVGIFKFDPNSNFNDGEFVSESVVGGFKSALEAKIHDHCFGEQYAPYYQQGRMQIVDDIDNAGLTDCHRDILAQFEIRANLAVPLRQGENLWGLLCINQCSQPRHWQDFEIELVQQVANQLAIAIQQADLYEQVQSELIIRKQAENKILLQLQRLKTIQDITEQIRGTLNLNDILATVTKQVQELMQVERVIVFSLFADGKSKIVEEAVANGYVALKDRHWDNETWSQEILDHYYQGKPRIVPDVMNDIWANCLAEYSVEGNIQSKIVAPILQELTENETGRWVNAPNNKLWGVLVVHACSTKRIWEESEAQLLQQIANQLAIAIQQADLFDQLQLSLVQEKEVSEMRSRFISMASHEFRTPLAIISSSTGILQTFSDRLSEEKKQAHLETIQKTIKHIVQLLDDVLMINRAEAEKMEFNPEALDIISFCRRLKEQIETTSTKHTIEFSLNVSEPIVDDTLVVQFDQKLIRQILTNLLSNAIKYSPENSLINFNLTIENNQLIFKIQDCGIGIPEQDQVNLFASFHRASNVGSISGTGLGLAIVKKCVDLHKGIITLDSQVDKGTIFTVNIPFLRG